MCRSEKVGYLMETRRFIIASSNKNAVIKQLEKMSKRAIRLSLPQISYGFDKPFVDTSGHLMIPIDISGPISVNYDNWEFVATLQHLPTGENIIRSISKDSDIPPQYRSNDSICEHCKVNRYRKDTYLVYHIHKNTYMQVGSSCIKDFLGGNSPDNILLVTRYLFWIYAGSNLFWSSYDLRFYPCLACLVILNFISSRAFNFFC